MEIAAGTGIEVDVERRTHLSVITVVGGAACIGPDHGRGSTFVDTREWIGEFETPEREDCLAELARRYFGAFAPATERDFAKWSGLAARASAASGMERIARELGEVGSPGPGALRAARIRLARAAIAGRSPACRRSTRTSWATRAARTPWTRRGRR